MNVEDSIGSKQGSPCRCGSPLLLDVLSLNRKLLGDQYENDNLYCCAANNCIDQFDIFGLLATTERDKTDALSVNCGGFLGLFTSKAGTITYSYYDISSGTALGEDNEYSIRLAKVRLKMDFKEENSCCCPSGDYRWKQWVVKDTDPGNKETVPYVDAEIPPYYSPSSSYKDEPEVYLHNLFSLNAPLRPTEIEVRFKTQLVCVEGSKDKVLKTINWGFKVKRLKKKSKDGLWYEINLF